MIFRKAEKEDFYKIRSLYWTLIDQEQDDPSFPHWKKGIHPSDEMIQDSIDTRQVWRGVLCYWLWEILKGKW